MTNSGKENNAPVVTLRYRDISAAVFKNEGKDGSCFYKVSFSKTYQSNGETKSTSSFGQYDLPLVADLAQQAWRQILTMETET